MKNSIIILALICFTLLFSNSCISQVKPIEESTYQNYKIYKCNNFKDMSNEVSNQGANINDLITKSNIEMVPISPFDVSFLEDIVSDSKYNLLKQNKTIMAFVYITDSNGNTLSTSFRMKEQGLSLNLEEIESILEESLSHKFNFLNKPNSLSVSNFYMMFNLPFYFK